MSTPFVVALGLVALLIVVLGIAVARSYHGNDPGDANKLTAELVALDKSKK